MAQAFYREKELIGFGLWLQDDRTLTSLINGGGFSWDWYNRESGNTYVKLKGTGRVLVTFVRGVNYEEIAAVEFLDDIVLRLQATPWFLFSQRETHHLVVTKGSVLRVAP